MHSHRGVLVWGVAILVAAILLAGCADRGTGSQPPASTRTLPPTPARIPTTGTPQDTPPPLPTLPDPTVSPVAGTLSQQGSFLQVTGPVLGFKGTGGTYLDLITFDLVKLPRVDPVDMEQVQVTLTRYSETTGLRFEITGRRNADSDSIVEDGETFVIAVPVKPDFWIYRNDWFELRMLAPGSAPILVQSQVPAVLEEWTILAEP
ncbi:MAG: hypothetical protein LUQ41_05840 [Methanomicrobiales archaeon]|nr:hypothetical protein [Methanomicrobiales archaeon]